MEKSEIKRKLPQAGIAGDNAFCSLRFTSKINDIIHEANAGLI